MMRLHTEPKTNIMKRLATCCCRDIGIEVEGEPEIHCVCHCDNCKRRTGSAFGISAYFKDAQIVQFIGETNVFEKINWLGDQKRHLIRPPERIRPPFEITIA